MNNNTESVIKGEAGLGSFAARVLMKWRVFLLAGVVLACLAGAFSYYRQKQVIRNWVEPEEQAEETEKELKAPDYTTVREKALKAINDKKEYFDQSILLKLNQAAVSKASVDFYIDTGAMRAEKEVYFTDHEEKTEGLSGIYVSGTMSPAVREVNMILDHYVQYVLRTINYTEIAEELDTSSQYIRELVSSGSDRETLRGVIIVSYLDNDGAQKILDYIIEKIKAHQPEAMNEFGDHEIKFRNQSVQIVTDTTTVSPNVATRVTEFNTLMKQYNDLKTNEGSLDVKMAAPAAVKRPGISRSRLFKYGVIGFIAGIFISAALYMLLLTVSSKVLSARDIKSVYGLKKLGVIPSESQKKLKGIDRIILASELKYQSNSDIKKSCEITDGNIKVVLGGSGRIALVSDLESGELLKLKDMLSECESGIEYVIAGDLSEPSLRKQLEESDGAVLAARVMSSGYKALTDLLHELGTCDKPVLGSIIF